MQEKKAKTENGGPLQLDILESYALKKNTRVLNTSILNHDLINQNDLLNEKINAFKQYLQVYGISETLKDHDGITDTQNKDYFHHHFFINHCWFVLEYYKLDPRTVVLTRFAPHENFKFRSISPDNIKAIAKNAASKEIVAKTEELEQNCKKKICKLISHNNLSASQLQRFSIFQSQAQNSAADCNDHQAPSAIHWGRS
ncbi:MAG: hypothetical protein FJ186_06030 [Gammaproteobacteria bacterium]|jgi:hypothetical protein|nr:hypothetical protein [Gammaproteobacteria bacterium]